MSVYKYIVIVLVYLICAVTYGVENENSKVKKTKRVKSGLLSILESAGASSKSTPRSLEAFFLEQEKEKEREREELKQIVNFKKKEIQKCLNENLISVDELRLVFNIALNFNYGFKGKVSYVGLINTHDAPSMPEPHLVGCIQRKLLRLDLPRDERRGNVFYTIKFPYIFIVNDTQKVVTSNGFKNIQALNSKVKVDQGNHNQKNEELDFDTAVNYQNKVLDIDVRKFLSRKKTEILHCVNQRYSTPSEYASILHFVLDNKGNVLYAGVIDDQQKELPDFYIALGCLQPKMLRWRFPSAKKMFKDNLKIETFEILYPINYSTLNSN